MQKCLHDFALYFDGKELKWRCYKCGKFLEEIPEEELDDLDLLLKKEFGGVEKCLKSSF